MKNSWFSAFCWIAFFWHPLEASTILQERLGKAKAGDYIVTESNKMISVLAIRSLTPKSLILEEIGVPAHAVDPRPCFLARMGSRSRARAILPGPCSRSI